MWFHHNGHDLEVEKDSPEYKQLVKSGAEPIVPPEGADTAAPKGDSSPPTPPSDPGKPDKSWRNDDIAKYAKEHGIDLGDATVKADMLAAIEKAETPANEDGGDGNEGETLS